MKEGGIEVLHVLDWLKREESNHTQSVAINSVFSEWINLINSGKGKLYAAKTIKKEFYTVVSFKIKPTGK